MYQGSKTVSQPARDAVKDTFLVLDKFLESSKWIAGDNLTIADFSLLTIVTTIAECGYDLAQHANLNRWYDQCHHLPGFEDNRKGASGLAARVNAVVEGSIF